MASKTVYFRADANSKIGLGHLTRLMALGGMIQNYFECCFLIQNPDNTTVESIKSRGFSFIALDSSDDFQLEANNIKNVIPDGSIIVLDGYHFDELYFKILRTKGNKLVLIDDFVKSYKNLDMIINHALGLKKSDYKHLHLKYFLGADHVLLRPSFLELAKNERTIHEVKKAFVCFGGADYHNLTLKFLKAVEDLPEITETHVVLAASFPFSESINNYVSESNKKIIIHHNLEENAMAELMSSCDFAFGPTSGLSFEICAAKLVFVGGYYVDNQKAIHDGFESEGCLVSMGDLSKVNKSEIVKKIRIVLNDSDLITNMIQSQKKVIDGNSDKRLLKAIMEL